MIDQREAISEKVVLIGVITQLQDQSQSKEYLDELEVPAEVLMFGNTARIITDKEKFILTRDTSADYIKDLIDEVYK